MMNNKLLEMQVNEISNQIDAIFDQQEKPEFFDLITQLETLSNEGSLDAAEYLAEIQAYIGPHHNAESSYQWHYIVLSQKGYSTNFDDKNNSPPKYCGPIGDFRNESLVNDLVDEIGFDRAKELDQKAFTWLFKKGYKSS